MEKTREQSFPRWLFAIIAIGGLLASGIYLGVMSVEGFTSLRMLQALGFGVLGHVLGRF
jgi:hypothetical protein